MKIKQFHTGLLLISGNGKFKFIDLKEMKEISNLYHSIVDRSCFGNFLNCPCDDCVISEYCNYYRLFMKVGNDN